MPKTNFVPNTVITSAFLNAINNPIFVANPNNDGELPLIQDSSLDNSPGSLLSRSNDFLNAFRATSPGGLLVTISAGTIILADGTAVPKTAAQLNVPANATRIIWVDPFGVFQVGANNPNDGSVLLARVVTDATSVIGITDLRPRFKIGSVDNAAPAVIGQSVFFEFPVTGREYTDEMGWVWLSPAGGVRISKGGSGGDVANDGYERLFKRLWTAPGYQVFAPGGSAPLAKGVSADADWAAGRHLFVRDPAGRSPLAAGTLGSVTHTVGNQGGEAQVTLTTAQMPSHSHSATSPPHQHQYNMLEETSNSGNTYWPPGNGEGNLNNFNTGAVAVSVAIGNTGGGGAHNNQSPFEVAFKMIFTGIKAA
jgi:microcystin-dependent protein